MRQSHKDGKAGGRIPAVFMAAIMAAGLLTDRLPEPLTVWAADPGRIELSADRTEIRPGETVTVDYSCRITDTQECVSPEEISYYLREKDSGEAVPIEEGGTAGWDSSGSFTITPDKDAVKSGGTYVISAKAVLSVTDSDGYAQEAVVTSNEQEVTISRLQYKVRYIDSIDNTTIDSKEVGYGETERAPEDPARKGYVFEGWFDGGSRFDFDTAIVRDLELRAKWTKIHTVTFDSGGHGKSVPASDFVRSGGRVTKPDDPLPESGRYRFKEWQKDGFAYDFDEPLSDEDGNITLTAAWQVRISFQDDPESVSSSVMGDIAPVYVDEKDGKLSGLPTAKKEGYRDTDKWYTDPRDKDTKVTADTTFNEPAVLYPGFTPVTFRLHFDPNKGGASTDTAGSVADMEDIPYDNDRMEDSGQRTFPYCTYTLPGYTFREWNTKADGSGTAYRPGAAIPNLTAKDGDSITLYAMWTANTCKVAYHSNFDGDTTMTSEEFTFDTARELDANPFHRPGYDFVGWTSAADGGTFFEDKEEVAGLAEKGGGQVDLYAQWEDTAAPSVLFRADAAKADGKKAEDGRLPMAKSEVEYTVTITDEGSGVDPDSVQYALCGRGTDTSDRAGLSGYVDAKGNYDKDDGTYTFTVTVPVQGFVVVKASDRNKDAFRLSEDKKADKNTGTKTFTKMRGKPNTGYSEAGALVLERAAPELHVTVEDAGVPQKSHEIFCDVSDMTEPYSGIQKVTWSLKKGEEQVIPETALIDNSQSAPKELEDLDSVKEYRKQEIAFDSGTYSGNYTLTVTAADWCGNEATATNDILYDNTPPAIAVVMGGTDGHGDRTGSYYKADNAQVTVHIGKDGDGAPLKSYIVTLTDEKGMSLTEMLADGHVVKHTGRADEKNRKADVQADVTFDTKEVAALADGTIRVTVEAEDSAGNGGDLGGRNGADIGVSNLGYDGTAASFILDKAAPVLIEIDTDHAGQGPYDADEDYYYKDPVTTVFTLQDEHPYTMSVSYRKDGEIQEAVKADLYADSVTFDYSCFTEGRYTDIRIYAHDRAGNALVLGDYKAARPEDRNARDGGDGTVTVGHNRIVDTTAPVAVITYSSDARAYLYPGETGDDYREGTAYINQDLRTRVKITDRYGKHPAALDAAKMTVTENGKPWDDGTQYSTGTGICDRIRTVSAEGSYTYGVYGTDRAGNSVTVREKTIRPGIESAQKLSEGQDYKETSQCGTDYHSRYRIVIDRTSPAFTFSLPKVSGGETVDGTTAYYGSVHRSPDGRFTVREANFDAARLGAGCVTENVGENGRYSQKELHFNKKNLGHGWRSSGSTHTLTKTAGSGICMYEISGCDKAGNPLVQSGAESKKGDYTETVAQGSGTFVTHYKVVDTEPPTGTLDIGDYYHVTMGRGGSNTLRVKGYDPYRKETKAAIRIRSNDRSPVRIDYDVVSTTTGTRSFERGYADDNRASGSVSGEQIFNVANLVLTDRAGNRSGFIKRGQTDANRIYLDVTPPTGYDIEKPVATVTSTTKVTKRSADGRDLYNRSVSLGLKVADPGAHVKSAGLRSVHYTVRADGRAVIDRTVDKNSDRAPLYNEQSLDYEWSLDLPVRSGGVFETNDIVVTLDAADNAGNRADTVTYKFGIDTEGPEVTVTYDNNSAQHGKYFKENRTATVTVLDRNIDDGGIKIRTQADVPAGYQYSSGGGNGAEDTWTKKITYASDGDYTLDIGGTDALGNRAAVRYIGTAAQEFTIDKTKPVISVTFDNNDVRNGRYYKDARNATVSIAEHNFLADEVKIVPTAGNPSGRGSRPDVRTGGFGGAGDRHTANVGFTADGRYSMTVNYTDMAGNPAEEVSVGEFVIDTTKPAIRFYGISQINGGSAAAAITVDDTNFSADLFYVKVAGTKKKDRSLPYGSRAFGTYGGTVSFKNIEARKENDDIYTITASLTDLAGNTSEESVTFSVNRFGSTFGCYDRATKRLVRTRYVNKEKKIRLVENNVNKLKDSTVTLYCDGENRTLVQGDDYTLEEKAVKGGFRYIYSLRAGNFSDEGLYSVVIQSEDEAGNKNTNASVKTDGGTDIVPVEFRIDKTRPASTLGGFDTDKYRFNENCLHINIKPTDDVRLASVRIARYDSRGNVLGNPVFYSYDEADIASGKAKDLSEAADEEGRIAYTVEGCDRDQYLEVIAQDAAGNDSDDHTYSEPENGSSVIRGTAQRMLVTKSVAAHYTHAPGMVVLTVVIAGGTVFFIIWERRKKKKMNF